MRKNPKTSSESRPSRTEIRFRSLMASLLAVVFLVLIWYGKAPDRTPVPATIVLYGFSIMEEVMRAGIVPAFQEKWRQETGDRVELIATFAGSGTISGRIIRRFPAEVAILSSELDVLRLVENGVLYRPAGRELPHQGVLTRTPFVIVVREGNPRGITDFADLARPGVKILHSDPTTSGGAQWSILAAYGSALLRTGDRELAFQQLAGIWRNVTAQVRCAREARLRFQEGSWDALITYEQDVIPTLAQEPVGLELVYPPRTIFSEHTVVRLDKNVTESQRPLIDAFVEFLWSRQAQQIFVDYGFRSPLEELNRVNPHFGVIDGPFTLDLLGGPRQAQREILDAVWRQRVWRELDRSPGSSPRTLGGAGGA